MNEIRFFLHIPAQDYLAYYQGVVREVSTVSHDGRQVRFPARVLQRFLTHAGIHGEFALRYDEHNRFAGIVKLRE